MRALRILLVEDDLLVRMSTADTLTDMGHHVIEAGNGQEALTLLEDGSVDVLMTDLGLPGMRGDRLALEVQARNGAPLGVIFASGRDPLARDDMDGALAGALFVTKPYSESELERALRKVCPV